MNGRAQPAAGSRPARQRQDPHRLLRQSVGEEKQAAGPDPGQGPGLHLQLPLVHGEDAGALDVGQEIVEAAGVLPQQPGVSGASQPLGAAAEGDDRPPFPDGRKAGDETLDALVKRCVEGIAAASRQDDVGWTADRTHGAGLDEGAGGFVGRFQGAGKRPDKAAAAVHDDVESEIDAGGPGDREGLLMEGIAFENGVGRSRIGKHLFPVEFADRFERGQARTDAFPAAGETGHEMRLDKPRHQPEAGFDEPPVETDGRAGGAPPGRRGQAGAVAGLVILDPAAVDDVRAEHLPALGGRARAMHPGGDQDENIILGNSGRGDFPEKGRQEIPVGDGPGDVGNDDDDLAGPAGAQRLSKGRGAEGASDGIENEARRRRRRDGIAGNEEVGVVGNTKEDFLPAGQGPHVHRSVFFTEKAPGGRPRAPRFGNGIRPASAFPFRRPRLEPGRRSLRCRA